MGVLGGFFLLTRRVHQDIDEAVLRKFDNGAALTRDPSQPIGKIVGIFRSGDFERIPHARPPKKLIVTRSGAVRGKRTSPPNEMY
jgi:hypothetical protein